MRTPQSYIDEALQVLVGRIDMEVAHCAILELKVGAGVRQQDVNQLLKYVHAKKACGMRVRHAAVVCFRNDHTVEIIEVQTE